MNNLLERLHASFFFYIMLNPGQFLKIGMYLPSAILVGASLMFGGLGTWTKAGWVEITEMGEKREPTQPKRWARRPRDLIPPLQIVVGTHAYGGLLFWTVKTSVVVQNPRVSRDVPFHAVYMLTAGVIDVYAAHCGDHHASTLRVSAFVILEEERLRANTHAAQSDDALSREHPDLCHFRFELLPCHTLGHRVWGIP
jgi:hypothetical protein